MTYAQVLAAVPTIAEFEPFIALCRDIGLHPYLEFKGTHTTEQIQALFAIVKKYQMERKVTWFGGTVSNLQKVQALDPGARLGVLHSSINSTDISNALALQNGSNYVFLDTWISNLTSAILSDVKASGLPLEVYTFGWTTSEITGMDRYITGFTSGSLIAGKVLYDAAMA